MRHQLFVLAMAILLVACGRAPAASTPTESPSSASPTPSAAVTSPPETATERPTLAPTMSPPPSRGPVEAWEMTATFDTSPGTSYVTDIVAWNGGFLAIGSMWETEYLVTAEMPAMWISLDGRSWNPHPTDLGEENVTLLGVVERADGRLLLVGRVPGSGGAQQEPGDPRNVAWISQDADRWQTVELPVSDDASVVSLAHGPRGYVLSAATPYNEFDPNADPTPGELWFSTDGIEWTKTHEGAVGAVAGDEGFVAIQSALAGGPSAVVASGDGQAWYASDSIGAPILDLAALGGDWLAVAYGQDSNTIHVLHSQNGLVWTPVLDVNDLTGPDGPKTGRGLNEAAINDVFLAAATVTPSSCSAITTAAPRWAGRTACGSRPME